MRAKVKTRGKDRILKFLNTSLRHRRSAFSMVRKMTLKDINKKLHNYLKFEVVLKMAIVDKF